VQTVRLLIEKRGDVLCKNSDDATPLHFAAYHGHDECSRLLLDRGADLQAKTFRGTTPESYAKARGHFQTADMLKTEALLWGVSFPTLPKNSVGAA
jgi:ankyrin repeat protein